MSQRASPFRAVAEHVYVATVPFAGEGEAGEVTVGLVVGSHAALLVDAGAAPEQGRSLREAVAAVTSQPLTTLVLTHWHYDHTFGAAGVDAETVVAHESVRERLTAAPSLRQAARLGLKGEALALPTHELAVAAAVDLGAVRVEAVHLGRGHTDGDLLVVVPGSDVVFAGDLVESSGPPQYGPDSFPHEWPATLDGLIGLTTDGTVVVPGHGGTLDRKAVFEQRGRVAAVSGEISRLAGLGVGVEEAETRGEWALPFAAVRGGYAVGCAQARATPAGRSLPLA